MMTKNPFQPADRIAAARQGVASFEKGKTYGKGRYVVRGAELKTKRDGSKYLSLTLGDRTGDASAICWDGAPLLPSLATGTVVEIDQVEVDEWGIKFEPQRFRTLPPGAYDPREFVASLPQELIELNWSLFNEALDSLQNPHLVRLREAIFGDPDIADKYKVHPSAVVHHHNYIGGNVQHVVGIMRIVDAVCASYSELDRDLVLFGAAIHDLGKLKEYAVDTTITVTEEGRLKGHLVLGAEWLGRIIARLREERYDFPLPLEQHLEHLILSHHRKGEWGSPKPPATPEAMLLHLADYADSQTKGFLQEVERNREAPEGWAKRFDPESGGTQWFKTRRDYA